MVSFSIYLLFFVDINVSNSVCSGGGGELSPVVAVSQQIPHQDSPLPPTNPDNH